tara:strand:- start:730 stop:966 length:237 start_codon:yes stop_codon:yes gene_type:complete
MKIKNPKFHRQNFTLYIDLDVKKLHEVKLKMGAIDKDTSIEDSLFHDLMQLEIDVKSFIEDYFNDYDKDIIIKDSENE